MFGLARLRCCSIFALAAALLCGTVTVSAPEFATAQSSAATGQSPTKPSISEKIAADRDKLDINTATAAQLKALPGIGDAYAARIIAGRPYTMKNQLTKRGILPESAYSAIAEKIIAHRPKK